MSITNLARPDPRALLLSDWGVLRARGDDAQSFLHGQLTSDMLHLDAKQARLAGYCSAKGRLLASFVVWRRAPGEVLLACSADLLGATLKRLSMFVLRARCKLDDASAELPLWGLTGNVSGMPDAAWQRAEVSGGDLVRLPDARADGQTVPRALFAGTTPPAPATLDAGTWRWLEVQSGVPRIAVATAEQFVPQMVNLELVGGVDFQKGCYPGQEVVARSQYRGTLKRRAFVLEGPAPMAPGQEVFHDADPAQPAGMVVLGAASDGRHAALVELKLAALEGGALHLGAADGPPLRPGALPYAVPAPA
jgi:folate-binding protein YgfZ